MAAKHLIGRTNSRYVRVAVIAPVHGLFDYRLDDDTSAMPGCRVRVPFGRRRLIAIVVECPATIDFAEVPGIGKKINADIRRFLEEDCHVGND